MNDKAMKDLSRQIDASTEKLRREMAKNTTSLMKLDGTLAKTAGALNSVSASKGTETAASPAAGGKAAAGEKTEQVTLSENGLAAAIAAAFGEIDAALLAAIEAVRTSVGQSWESMKVSFDTAVGEAIGQLKTVLATSWGQLKQTLDAARDSLKGKFGDAFDGAKSKLKETLGQAWDDLGDSPKKAWETLKGGVGDTIESFRDDIKQALIGSRDQLKDALKGVLDSFKDSFLDVFEGLWDKLKSSALQIAGNLLDSLKDSAGNILKGLWENLKDIFNFGDILEGVWDKLKETFDLGDILGTAWEKIKETFDFGDVLSTAGGKLKELLSFDGILDSIGGALSSVLGGIGSFLSSAVSKLASVFNGSFFSGTSTAAAAGGAAGGIGFSLPGFGGLSNFATSIATSSIGQALGLSTLAPVAGGQIVRTALGDAFVGGVAGAPWGSIGSIGASLLGLSSGNMLIDTGAGLLGSIGGGMAGSALGTALGFAGGGPIGAIVGSFLASALAGGIFGEDKDYPFAKGDVNLSGGELDFTTDSLDGGDEQQASQLTQAVVSGIESFLSSAGGSLSGDLNQLTTIGYASGRSAALGTGFFAGGKGDFNNGADFTNIEDPELAVALAIRQGILKSIETGALEDVSDEFADAVKTGLTNAATDDAEQLASDIDFSIFYGHLLDGLEEPLTAVEQTFESLADQTAEATEQAERLGLALAPVTDHFEQLTQDARDAVQNDFDRQTRALTGEGYLSAIEDIVAQREVDLANAAAAGLDASEAERLFDLRLRDVLAAAPGYNPAAVAELLEEAGIDGAYGVSDTVNLAAVARAMYAANLERITQLEEEENALRSVSAAANDNVRALENAASSFRISSELSALSPFEQLEEARTRFEDALALANDNDPTDAESQQAISELPSLSATLLRESRDYYATSEGYLADFNHVQDALAGTAANQRSIAEEQLSALETIEEELKEIRGELGEDETGPTYVQGGDGQYVSTGLNGTPAGIDLGYRPDANLQIYRALTAAGIAFPGAGEGQLASLRVSNPTVDAILRNLGFNTGGSGTVRGPSGTDNLLVPLRLTAGELVNVSRKDTMGEVVVVLKGMAAEMQALRAENADMSRRLAQATAASGEQIYRTLEAGNRQRGRMIDASQQASALPSPRKLAG